MNPPYSVAICVPVSTECKSLFAYDLARLVGYTSANGNDIITQLMLFFSEGTLIAPQRTELVDRALTAEATHILWLDSDMRFPKDALERLLARNRPIVGANYTARRMPHGPTAFATITTGVDTDFTRLYTTPDSVGLEQCAALGFGVALTQMKVFEEIPSPWFATPFVESDDGFMGEDIYFAVKARKAGFEVFCDHDLSKEVRHIGPMEYAIEHSLALQELEG